MIVILATQTLTLPFDSLEGLVDNSNYHILVVTGTAYEDTFKTAKEPVWQKAWTDRVQPYLAGDKGKSKDDLVAIVAEDPVAAIYDNYFSIM